jgi:hypothetical protein
MESKHDAHLKAKIRALDEYVYFKQEEHFQFENAAKMEQIMQESASKTPKKGHLGSKVGAIGNSPDFKIIEVDRALEQDLEIGIIDMGRTSYVEKDRLIDLSKHELSNTLEYKKWRLRVDDAGNTVPRKKIFG